MAKGSENVGVPNTKKYGVPFYGADWVPTSVHGSISESSKSEDEDLTFPLPSTAAGKYLVLAGGGGKGSTGIPNALLIVEYDFDSNSLSDQPVAKLETGEAIPYRIAVHPGGGGVICSLPDSCQLFEWDAVKSKDARCLSLKSSEKVLSNLSDVGQQLALTFNNEGSLLALGGEDGKLRVLKWPSMELIIDEANAHKSVKGLNFSQDGKFLASVGDGPGRVWDVKELKVIISLERENNEVFSVCKFSRTSDANEVLYSIAMKGGALCISKWNTSTWKKIGSKNIGRDPVSAFDVSHDGKLLAVGTIEGDILVLSSSSMQLQTVIRRAHLGLVTALVFSPDSRFLASTSMDSSARVTQIKCEKEKGLNTRTIFIFIFILLAIAAYYVQNHGLLSLKF